MSRIGKAPVIVPEGVEVSVEGQSVKAKGKLGELTLPIHNDVSVEAKDVKTGDDKTEKHVILAPKNDSQMARQVWPTMRTLVNNIIIGVSEGYSKTLEIKGVGYRANLQGQDLVLSLGFSHEVRHRVPEGIKVEMDGQTIVKISGIDKQRVGQVAAEIRAYRPPEPYKGKGVRYQDEYVLRKEGKKK